MAEDGEVVAGLEVAGLEAAGLEAGDFEGADSAAGVSAADSGAAGSRAAVTREAGAVAIAAASPGTAAAFESGNVGGYPREATVSRGPVSPGWRGNELRGDRFNRFRRGEYGGYGGWGYWLGDDYWGFYSPWWFGGFPFWYSDLGSADYSNPYYDMNPVDYGNYDYGVPIQQASAEPSPEEGPSFTAAREAFKAGNYQEALNDIKQAIVSEPQSQDIHEFHALILFAMGDYQRAAAVAYDVLNAGPGWDWTILQSFYPSVDVYTQQLRALEHYVSEHTTLAASRFLLGDQYLMLGHWNAADRQFAQVVELQPRDLLSKNILAGLDRALGEGSNKRRIHVRDESNYANIGLDREHRTAFRPGSCRDMDFAPDAHCHNRFCFAARSHVHLDRQPKRTNANVYRQLPTAGRRFGVDAARRSEDGWHDHHPGRGWSISFLVKEHGAERSRVGVH